MKNDSFSLDDIEEYVGYYIPERGSVFGFFKNYDDVYQAYSDASYSDSMGKFSKEESYRLIKNQI